MQGGGVVPFITLRTLLGVLEVDNIYPFFLGNILGRVFEIYIFLYVGNLKKFRIKRSDINMKSVFLFLIMMGWLGANTVKDYDTDLMWQDNHDAKSIKRDWQGAKNYCQELTLSGYSDWRLPVIKELQSIVDITRHDPAIKKIFNNVSFGPMEDYWSATESVFSSQSAWRVSFDDGTSISRLWNETKSDKYFIRCVRAGQ